VPAYRWVADIAGSEKNRQPEINNGLIFSLFISPKRASQLTPSTRLKLQDVTLISL
jgi:hypothetical protein